MLDKVKYALNIALARSELTTSVDGFTGTRRNPSRTRAGWGSFTIRDDETPVELLVRLDNLYLEGFRNNANQVILQKNSGYAINVDVRLPFGNEYGELGYNRQVAITITIEQFSQALSTLYFATADSNMDAVKKAFLYTAIGFSEAIRFDDVLAWIYGGEPITDLDWDKHKDQSKVRVVQR